MGRFMVILLLISYIFVNGWVLFGLKNIKSEKGDIFNFWEFISIKGCICYNGVEYKYKKYF